MHPRSSDELPPRPQSGKLRWVATKHRRISELFEGVSGWTFSECHVVACLRRQALSLSVYIIDIN
jgi:hypothetical protein